MKIKDFGQYVNLRLILGTWPLVRLLVLRIVSGEALEGGNVQNAAFLKQCRSVECFGLKFHSDYSAANLTHLYPKLERYP